MNLICNKSRLENEVTVGRIPYLISKGSIRRETTDATDVSLTAPLNLPRVWMYWLVEQDQGDAGQIVEPGSFANLVKGGEKEELRWLEICVITESIVVAHARFLQIIKTQAIIN